jgi:hypothetical protein
MRIMNHHQLILLSLVSFIAVFATAFIPSMSNSRRAFTFSKIPVLMSDVTEEEVQKDETLKPDITITSAEATATEKSDSASVEGAEDQSNNPKRKVARERHTVFVGNLPFGTDSLLI